MKIWFIYVVLAPFSVILCYGNNKNNLLSGFLLRGLINQINHDKSHNNNGDISYLDLTNNNNNDEEFPVMDNRANLNRDLEEEQMFPVDYDTLGDSNMLPSIRDQEYLQHSNSLWGNQYNSGDDNNQQLFGSGIKFTKQEIKTDSSLPAYCNPPNPCPIGFNGEEGCLEDFENSASFSRNYQALQDCMCDSEHMFDCPIGGGGESNSLIQDDPLEMARANFNRLLQESLKNSIKNNPFLTGEKLPIAAKKGNNMF